MNFFGTPLFLRAAPVTNGYDYVNENFHGQCQGCSDDLAKASLTPQCTISLKSHCTGSTVCDLQFSHRNFIVMYMCSFYIGLHILCHCDYRISETSHCISCCLFKILKLTKNDQSQHRSRPQSPLFEHLCLILLPWPKGPIGVKSQGVGGIRWIA
jgi:hypothetical protein